MNSSVAPVFEIQFSNGDTLLLEGADTYQPEGPMTTFFTTGSSRQIIDSWSTRIASYRTADICSVRQHSVRSAPRHQVIDVAASNDLVSLAA